MQINRYNRVHQQSRSLNVCSWYFFTALDKSVLQRNRNTISFLQKEKTHKPQIRLCIHNYSQAQSCGASVSFSIGPMCKYQFNVMKMAPICDFTVPKNYLLFCHTPIITRSEKQSVAFKRMILQQAIVCEYQLSRSRYRASVAR